MELKLQITAKAREFILENGGAAIVMDIKNSMIG